MNITQTKLPGVWLLQPVVHGDERGFFLESFRADHLRAAGIPDTFVQANQSRSRGGVLRGLHYQLRRPQGKLVKVARGAVYDVAVDIRRGSPHFGQWYGHVLDDRKHEMLYIPPGFAHGFCVLGDEADFVYQCTDYYDAGSEYGIAWDDPDLAVAWPDLQVQLSAKDRLHPRLALQNPEHLPEFRA